MADNLPLYGVCCYMEEIVHRPPTVLRGGRAPSAPLSRYMVSAPRCYCFLTHQPFFSLHFKVGGPRATWLFSCLRGPPLKLASSIGRLQHEAPFAHLPGVLWPS